jgi:hypothetical protein
MQKIDENEIRRIVREEMQIFFNKVFTELYRGIEKGKS